MKESGKLRRRLLREYLNCLVACLPLFFFSLTTSFAFANVCRQGPLAQDLSITISNPSSSDLHDYPVAIALDKTNFEFSKAGWDGSGISVWDSLRRPVAHWLESYDRTSGEAMLWVKVPFIAAGNSLMLRLTAGNSHDCVAQFSNGYQVFPFFSDVHDLINWNRDPFLSLTRYTVSGPLLVKDKQVVESDGFYNSTPGLAEASNGDWVLTYLKGTGHVSTAKVVLRRSQDHGQTWSPEVAYFDTATLDPTLVRTPNGDLLLALVKRDPSGASGGSYSRSQDNGLTWGAFKFVDDPVSNTLAFGPLSITEDSIMFGVGYGPSSLGDFDTPTFWLSGNDGETWTKRSELAQAGETGINETAVIQTGLQELLAVSRADGDSETFGHRSVDEGFSWGSAIDYTPQVGAIHAPQLIRVGRALILIGREALGIPHVAPELGFPKQLVAYVSYDNGRHFGHGTVLDTYTGFTIDGGYSTVLPLAGNRLFVAYYGDSHGLRQPDIKSLVVRVVEPQKEYAGSLHLLTQLADTKTTHSLNLNLARYSLDFRFHSRPTPAGTQFAVSLLGPGAVGTSELVRWELPSIHATDPTSQSGILVNHEFVRVLNSFVYGNSYRIRTIVDENQGTQVPQILGTNGEVLTSLPPQPFAQGETLHPDMLTIGNGSTLRATDTLLDFVFIRPVSDVEPEVTVRRVR
jgi:Domain of unknown function (DUF2341)/BNR repeat-like domain